MNPPSILKSIRDSVLVTSSKALFISSLLFGAAVHAADVNVLIVGTTYDTGEYGTNAYGTSKAYDINKVRAELEAILGAADMGTVQVSLHDYSSNGPTSGYGNRLIEEFLSEDTDYLPTAAGFWNKLRGGDGHPDWDVVILMGEPYTIEYFPGLYTLGASEIRKEVAKGEAETVLFMGWPAAGSDSTVDHYKEVVYRTGRSMGCKVVPAGLVWENKDGVYGSYQGGVHGASHPTDDGSFLAAAAIYSRVWGVEGGLDRSASEFTNGNDALADAAHAAVKANKGAVQYTGKFTPPSNVFAMLGDRSREWGLSSADSSTENTLKIHTARVAREANMDLEAMKMEAGPNGLFVTRDSIYHTGAAMSCGFWHPGSGEGSGQDPTLEPRYDGLIDNDFGFELRRSRSNLDSYAYYRHLPSPALWAMVSKEMPSTPFIEAQHGGRGWGWSSGAYMLTLKTGRCPMIPDLAEPTIESNAIQVGYETAWRMATLQGRAPGFKVMPSSWRRHTVDPAAPETMTVRFMFQPTHDVTVNISSDKSWAAVSPAQLTFTPENYNTPQEVRVTLAPETADLRGEVFNVSYTTTSSDEVCNDLSDSWEYKVNTPPVVFPKSESVQAGATLVTTMDFEDPDIISKIIYKPGFEIPKQIISYEIVSGPNHGSIAVNGGTITYTADSDFSGVDTIIYRVNDGFTNSVTDEAITITVLASGQYDLNLLSNPDADFGITSWVKANSFGVLDGCFATDKGGRRPPREVYTLHQDVDLSEYSAAINAGLQQFHLSGEMSDLDTTGELESRILMEFRDINGNVLGATYDSGPAQSSSMVYKEATLLAPVNAVTARFILRAERLVDQKQGVMKFDNLSLTAIKPPNRAPVAVDPPQFVIAENVPTVITLEAIDLDRYPSDPLIYEILEGPTEGQLEGGQDGKPLYTPKPNWTGTDSFTYRVSDGQVWSENTATASILVRENQAPSIVVHTPVMPADAAEPIYMAATNGLIFETTITDDGAPYPSNLSIQWEQVSAPGDVVAEFGSPNSAVTTCNWGDFNDGTYEFKVTASDGQYETVKTFKVTVLNGGYDIESNVAVQVDVGGPYGVVTAGSPLTLQGSSLSDDGEPLDPGLTVVQWLQVSGPGMASFSTPNQYETDVSFDAPGTYVLRLTGDDGQIKSYEDLILEVVAPTPPSVEAGENQNVSMDGAADAATPDAFYVYDAAENADTSNWASTTVNNYNWSFTAPSVSAVDVADDRFFSLTKAYEFPTAKSTGGSLDSSIIESGSGTWEFVLDVDEPNGMIMESGGGTDGFQFWVESGALKGHIRNGGSGPTVSYALTEEDMGRFIHVVFVIDVSKQTDNFSLYVDGDLISSGDWIGNDWCGSNDAGLGTVGSSSATGFSGDFAGKMALIRYYQDKAFSPQEVTDNFNSLAPGVIVNLAGEVIEGGVASPAITWSVVEGDASQVIFGDVNALVTTATFTAADTYTLKLTADDGVSQISDYVTIKVSGTYAQWIAKHDLGDQTGFSQDPDGDGISNGLESYFGTDPGSATTAGVTAGSVERGTDSLTFTFSHPINDNPSTDITANYRWSSNLGSFHLDGATDGSTVVNFTQSPSSSGWVTVTATATGVIPERLFIDIEVSQ